MEETTDINKKYSNLIDYKKLEIKDLPDGVNISTMCASCNLKTTINIANIEKYMELNSDNVLCIKKSNDNKRTIIPEKKKNKRYNKIEEKKKNYFYNQITIVMRINEGEYQDLNLEPKINLKLFKNGSIQMSGCKSIKNINIVLNKLINKLKIVKAKFEDNKIIEKTYVDNPQDLIIEKFKVDMINSNYCVNIQIDRENLFNLLLKKKIKCSFEPSIRACVIIKYFPELDNDAQKAISIFIFQKGNIIITGARQKSHILSAYKYINDILINHQDEINKKDELIEENLIQEIYDNIMKDVDSGLIKL
jgi:TATA-box binding protein (TBP) (component of TFIID and TFIIIB)